MVLPGFIDVENQTGKFQIIGDIPAVASGHDDPIIEFFSAAKQKKSPGTPLVIYAQPGRKFGIITYSLMAANNNHLSEEEFSKEFAKATKTVLTETNRLINGFKDTGGLQLYRQYHKEGLYDFCDEVIRDFLVKKRLKKQFSDDLFKVTRHVLLQQYEDLKKSGASEEAMAEARKEVQAKLAEAKEKALAECRRESTPPLERLLVQATHNNRRAAANY